MGGAEAQEATLRPAGWRSRKRSGTTEKSERSVAHASLPGLRLLGDSSWLVCHHGFPSGGEPRGSPVAVPAADMLHNSGEGEMGRYRVEFRLCRLSCGSFLRCGFPGAAADVHLASRQPAPEPPPLSDPHCLPRATRSHTPTRSDGQVSPLMAQRNGRGALQHRFITASLSDEEAQKAFEEGLSPAQTVPPFSVSDSQTLHSGRWRVGDF